MSIKTNKIKRVADKKAHFMVNSGTWKYIPKQVWKEYKELSIRTDNK
jgi:hypothetical protein